MQSLYDFTYEQMRDLAEVLVWKKFSRASDFSMALSRASYRF